MSGEEIHKENKGSETLWTWIRFRTMRQEGTCPSVNVGTNTYTGYVATDQAVYGLHRPVITK